MSRYSLGVHSLTPLIRASTTSRRELGDCETKDLLDVIETQIKTEIAKAQVQKYGEALFEFKSVVRMGRRLWGEIEYGHYGTPGRGVDEETRTESYKRNRKDAELRPHYFLYDLPSKARVGMLIVHNTSNRGPKAVLEAAMRPPFSLLKKTTFRYDDLVPDAVLKAFFDRGDVKKLVFTKFSVPKDLADQVGKNNPYEVQAEYVLKTVRGGSPFNIRNQIGKFLRGQADPKTLFSLPSQFEDPDMVSVIVDIGGALKSVELTNPQKIRSAIDVTDRIGIMSDGHPDPLTIRAEATDLADRYRRMLDASTV